MRSEGGAYVIAEAGVNHNGDIDMALRLIDVAADAGADAVKFQTFRAEDLVTETAPKAAYQLRRTDTEESQYQMLRKLELSPEMHLPLIARCEERHIDFLSTPFDAESLRFLASAAAMPAVKVPSGEITNGPFLLEIAKAGLPIILSTGMSTLDEVEDALAVLAWGRTEDRPPSSRAELRTAFRNGGRAALAGVVTVLHCTSDYPAPAADANLRAMDTLRDAFGLPVGLSDHSEGIYVALAAVARGASIIEKHFTLDRALPGPDHAASLEPGELREMIAAIRIVEAALGDGVKQPRPSEEGTRAVARRSLVALRDIPAGTTLAARDLGAKRPGDGLSPMAAFDLVGTPAPSALKSGEKVTNG